MKFLILALFALTVAGCSSTPKVLMKNCKKLQSGYYECEEVREQRVRDVRR